MGAAEKLPQRPDAIRGRNVRYEGTVYRPPGERHSYLLQVTVGCSHNACSFCNMYKGKGYRVRPMAEILEDIRMAKAYFGDTERVFLCDGDALGLPTEDLLTILKALYEACPSLKKVGVYAGPKNILEKTPEELRLLRKAGLTRGYLGVESGSDEVLRDICKGVGAREMLEAGVRLRESGIDLWVMILLGLAGGGEAGVRHALASAEMMNEMKPRHLSLLSLVLEEGAPLYAKMRRGEFVPANAGEVLEEVRCMVECLTVDPLHFTCDHASNYLPLKGSLPEERDMFLRALDDALCGKRRVRPEWSRQV